MTSVELVEWLLSEKISAEGLRIRVDRLLLRVLYYPPLLAYLKDVVYGSLPDKKLVAQLKFKALPNDMLKDLQQLMGGNPRITTFSVDGTQYTGVEVDL